MRGFEIPGKPEKPNDNEKNQESLAAEMMETEEGVLRKIANSKFSKKAMKILLFLTLIETGSLALPKEAEAGGAFFKEFMDTVREPFQKKEASDRVYNRLKERDERARERARYEEGVAYEEKYIAEHGTPSRVSVGSGREDHNLTDYDRGRMSVIRRWEWEQRHNRRRAVEDEGEADGYRRYREEMRNEREEIVPKIDGSSMNDSEKREFVENQKKEFLEEYSSKREKDWGL